MKFTTISRRIAATGAVTAMAAGALVGLTGTTANAAEVTTTYTCELASVGLGPWDVTVVSNAVGIEGIPGLPAGYEVAAGSLTVTNHFTIPDDAYNTLGAYGVENITFPDYAGEFGDQAVGVTGMAAKVSEMTDNGDGTHSFDSDGVNAAFEAPAAGVHDVLSPSGFNMVADVPGIGLVPVPCALAEGATQGVYTTMPVVKNDSTTTGTAAPVTKGEVSKVKITVAAPNETPSGKVVVKKGTNKLGTATLNSKGKAVFKHKFPVGKNKVTLIYKGDGYTNGSRTAEPVIVKVTR